MAATVELKELIEHCVHFGHRTCFWEPKMAPYIYGKKSKDLHIINLLKTRPLFQKALNEIEAVAANNGRVLLVSTKRVAQEAVESAAKRCEMPYVSKRWPGGMLTNFKTILRSVKKMKQLESYVETEEFAAMKKKERLSVQRDLGKLQASFNGIRDMASLPDMIFIIDVGHEHIAVREAKKLGIPVVGIVDTNCSPEDIDYVIPGNDDSQKSINLYTRLVADTVHEARAKIREKIKAEEVKLEGKTKVKVMKKAPTAKKEEVVDVEVQEKAVKTSKGSPKITNKKSEGEGEKKIIRVAAKKPIAEKKVVEKATKKPVTAKKTAVKKAESTSSSESKQSKKEEADKKTEVKAKSAAKKKQTAAKEKDSKPVKSKAVAAKKGKAAGEAAASKDA